MLFCLRISANKLLLFLLSIFFNQGSLKSQMTHESVISSTSEIGISAISINTISAKTLNFEYPLFDCYFDSLTQLLFFSGKQKTEQLNQLMSRNYFGAISAASNAIKWFNESVLFDIDLSGGCLLLSNENRTVRYNKSLGYDEFKFPARFIYYIPKTQLGLMYTNKDNTTIQCVNLKTGTIKWSCAISGQEDWVDIKLINDSILLLAANGLHAIHPEKGLLWSQSLSTSVLTNKSLIYSLAKQNSLEKVSQVIHTALDENRVTQLASNILYDGNSIYFASREKFISLDLNGRQLWQLDLRNYPISKMYISKTDSSIILVNFGLAAHSDNLVNWGKPFVLILNPLTGSITNQYDLSKISNLADFMNTKRSLIFAGKDEILDAIPGESELKTILSLNENKYGKFVEFIDGNQYYIFKEGYYVPLNFINDNLIYFKTDNNKIYGVEGDYIQYEYHFTELYELQHKFDGMTMLTNAEKTIITSGNFELLFTFDLSDRTLLSKDKIYFIGEKRITILNKSDLK